VAGVLCPGQDLVQVPWTVRSLAEYHMVRFQNLPLCGLEGERRSDGAKQHRTRFIYPPSSKIRYVDLCARPPTPPLENPTEAGRNYHPTQPTPTLRG
jgi:hypothetical protein